MRKLHAGIRAGFQERLKPVSREDFRRNSGLSQDAEFFIAANFFLFNIWDGKSNIIPVDELVRHAVQDEHSVAFDRLGLFALNLSMGGRRGGNNNGVEFPALWANQFVKNDLWANGRWQRASLNTTKMDASILPNIIGGKIKNRTNYRYMFQLARFLPSKEETIFTDPEMWAAGALFLAWDRRSLSMGAPYIPVSVNKIIENSVVNEDYKLIGIDKDEFLSLANPIAEQYIAAGGINRFDPAVSGALLPLTSGAIHAISRRVRSPAGGSPGSSTAAAVSSADMSWLSTDAATDAAVARRMAQRLMQQRDQIIASNIKSIYDYCCMACDQALVVSVSPERLYAEAAHIQPLGIPHNGPDTATNMIVLCPNHHLQFDRGVISIKSKGSSLRFVSHIPSDPVHDKPLALKPGHKLDPKCLAWHAALFASVSDGSTE